MPLQTPLRIIHHARHARGTSAGLVAALALVTVLASRPSAAPADDLATEANITRLTTSLLESSQLGHHPLDAQFAGKLLEHYLDALDGSRSVLLEADVEAFARLQPALSELTRATGDTSAAHVIFKRYCDRLGQQLAYVQGLLRKPANFDFTGHDLYMFDREHAERPRDLAAAQALWRQQLRVEYLQEKLGGAKPDTIAATLAHRHQHQLKILTGLRSDDVLELYLDALAHVYDPHSDYLGHEQMESLAIALNLSLVGIGASLESHDGSTRVRELVPGGPAARTGLLKPGDRIVAVGQEGKDPVDITSLPLSRAVELIRGPQGSTVTLSVVPAGAAESAPPKVISLVRDKISLQDQEAKARIVDLRTGGEPIRLGVIDLPSFYAEIGLAKSAVPRSATADVALLLSKLKKEHVRGVVLDLRHNGGGSLEEAIGMTGLFIRRGPVVQMRGPTGKLEVAADEDPRVVFDGPLVLLISRFSASASEILAGALQDYGRAVVVGDSSTFGKGTVQSLLPLAHVMDQNDLPHSYDPGELKITISKFYRPSGSSTQLRGVPSDIVLPSTSDVADIGEKTLPDPLPWDTVPPAPFQRVDRVSAYLAALRERSAERVVAAKAFVYVRQDVARLKELLSKKTISLNEGERRQELARAKARRAERERDERSLTDQGPTTYDITLKSAALPGLPSPTHGAGADGSVPLPEAGPKAAAGGGADDEEDTATDRRRAEATILTEGLNVLRDYVHLLSREPRSTALGW